MTKMTLIYWKGDKFWLGKLLQHPEIMTQGETLEELEENIKDAYLLMTIQLNIFANIWDLISITTGSSGRRDSPAFLILADVGSAQPERWIPKRGQLPSFRPPFPTLFIVRSTQPLSLLKNLKHISEAFLTYI